MKTENGKKGQQVGHDQGAFIRHLEESTKKVCSWPKWKQNLLGVYIKETHCADSVQKR